MSAEFRAAYVKYHRMFPDLESLGVDAATWAAELDRIEPGAFDAIQATSISLEAGNLSGVANFNQITLIRALYARRAALDPEFDNPFLDDLPEEQAAERTGIVVHLR